MAEKAQDKQAQQAQPAQDQPAQESQSAAQDLPPTHPNDPTETTLTQDAGPDEDARREAVAKRTAEGAERSTTGTSA